MTLSNFNAIDYTFIAVFCFFVLLSLWRGLVREIISLLAWLVGLLVGMTFAPKLAALFANSSTSVTSTSASISEQMAGSSSPFTIGLCFVVLLVGCLIIGAIINYFLAVMVEASGLTIFNRLLGGIFGFAKAFIIELAIVFFVSMTAYAKEPLWQKSEVVSAYQPVIATLTDKFGSSVGDLRAKMTEFGVSNP